MKTLLPSSAKNVSGGSFWRRRGRSILICGVAAILFGCVGYLTPAIQIGTTTATLTAQATCTGDTPSNPCAYWFQYWADGAAKPTSTETLTYRLDGALVKKVVPAQPAPAARPAPPPPPTAATGKKRSARTKRHHHK